MAFYNENQIKGMIIELEVAKKLIELGYIVSFPYGNNARYDLLLDCGNQQYFRIQCKSASFQENNSYIVKTSNEQFTSSARNLKIYTLDQIDFIASIIDNQLLLYPAQLITGKEKRFRLKKNPPANNSCISTVNWVEDYSFEKQILPLLKNKD